MVTFFENNFYAVVRYDEVFTDEEFSRNNNGDKKNIYLTDLIDLGRDDNNT